MADRLDKVLTSTIDELSPAIMGGTFLAMLAALTVNGYLKDIISQIVGLIPIKGLGSTPAGKIVFALGSMLLALLVLGAVYSFVIQPIYAQSISNASN